jgi:hypothetical protein
MHVAERNRELERQRKQRQIRTRSFTRPQPTHGRHAARVSCRGRTILPVRACRFSNNVTFAKMRRRCDSSGVLQKINIPASTILDGSADHVCCRDGAKRDERIAITFTAA